jgi:hypothetical protein
MGIVPLVIGLEVAIAIGAQIGIHVMFITLTIFLLFAWLLLESVKSARSTPRSHAIQGAALAEARP